MKSLVPAAGFEPATNGLQNRLRPSRSVFMRIETSPNAGLFSAHCGRAYRFVPVRPSQSVDSFVDSFWLRSVRRTAPRAQVHPPPSSTELVPVDPPQKLIPIDEKPADIVERFFLEVVHPVLNRRVRSLVMWEAFQQWCADRSIDIAISHAMFGRLARRQKGRVGGTVWYLDCELAEGYAVHEPKALPRPRLVAEGSQVTH